MKGIYERDGKWFFTTGEETEFGPYETAGQANTFSIAVGIGMDNGQPMPQPSQRWKHYNGNEYTVIALSNEYSEELEHPPTVVYQGDNGRMWSRTLRSFMAKLTFVAGAGQDTQVTDVGTVTSTFTDAIGMLCSLEEGAPGDTCLYLGVSGETVVDSMGTPSSRLMALDPPRVRDLVPYLLYYLRNGRLPDEPLPREWMYQPLEGNDQLDYARLLALTSQPEIWDFSHAFVAEAAFQSLKWSAADDEKTPTDFVFLIGALLGKAIEAHYSSDGERLRHHVVAAGAALWQMFTRFGGETPGDSFTKPE